MSLPKRALFICKCNAFKENGKHEIELSEEGNANKPIPLFKKPKFRIQHFKFYFESKQFFKSKPESLLILFYQNNVIKTFDYQNRTSFNL